MQRFPKFDYSLVTFCSIEKALDLVQHFDLHNIPDGPIDISALWDWFDVRVMDLPLATWGFTMDMAQNGIVIAVNRLLPPSRQLFTFGHEVGHVLMHHPDQLLTCLTGSQEEQVDYNRLEVEATTIAAYLLIPQKAVIENLHCYGIKHIASEYMVPEELVVIRWVLYKRTGV